MSRPPLFYPNRDSMRLMYKKNMVTYEPLGVVGACVSWNYPLHNFIGPIISSSRTHRHPLRPTVRK
jgi:acyl-CoA reductase-like NAD-dependent aldehyde dehydrogenase